MTEHEPPKLRLDDYDYDLPRERIALHPAPERDASRLLVLARGGAIVGHHHFRDLPRFLRAGDLLVLNDTFVIPARLTARRHPSGGRVEIFLLRPERPGTWEALWRPHRRVRPGMEAVVEEPDGEGGTRAALHAEVVGESPGGHVLVRFQAPGGGEVRELLDRLGDPPIPPYIKRAPQASDRERYQTVYARARGSVAAPTAGLHFTPALLRELEEAGVGRATVTLHVGLATFQPLTDEAAGASTLGEEWIEVTAETARAVMETRGSGGRVVAVGTTVVRSLESAWRDAQGGGELRPYRGGTNRFIKPPYRFRAVDAMVTNFHLPRSSLLLLAAAFAGREALLAAYHEALRLEYRFASYGDAMLIL